ncbi:MAG TPA: aldose epimerase [Pseudoxanthomonas sp.]
MAAKTPTTLPDAFTPLVPGPLIRLSRGDIEITVAPQAGGRIAQITRGGVGQLASFDESNNAMIAWGCYPMLPWAGRVRRGAFEFEGKVYRLPLNMGLHSIHGVGFAMAWEVDSHNAQRVELSLELPRDERWPFGGSAHQRIELEEDQLLLTLSVSAGPVAMPATIGWHPWFLKPDRLRFAPSGIYPRDEDGIATLPVASPSPGPWDDCFINTEAVTLERGKQQLTLSSNCSHWVVYDQSAGATCVEPQSGPPDAFNIEPFVLAPGQTLTRWFRIAWAGD